MGFHKGDLFLEFKRQPYIVRIKKGYVLAFAMLNTQVP
jgi:hypothetical protein